VVLEFKRLHLRQQVREREKLEETRGKCRMVGPDGQPLEAFIYADAMTESQGDTPKLGRKDGRHSKPGKVIKNRTFCVEVSIITSSLIKLLFH
jgi:hypothetical protein